MPVPLVFPAHAGMDRWVGVTCEPGRSVPRTRGDGPRCARALAKLAIRVPRTRGDGPNTASTREQFGISVPRTRGDGPQNRWRPILPFCVFPAHAGMDRSFVSGLPPHGTVFPAHAGMDRSEHPDWSDSPWCSPHTRGWTEQPELCCGEDAGVPRTRGDGPADKRPNKRRDIVFPAHAGMDRGSCTPIRSPGACSPHTRGWTAAWESFQASLGRVPRTRGDGPVRERLYVTAAAVFPAHAGMDPEAKRQGDGPRSCSPHTRGWTALTAKIHEAVYVFPAHAGMDRDAPVDALLLCWVFPAHAGMDRLGTASRRPPHGVPRTRGDGPGSPIQSLGATLCSPHTRGWTVPFSCRQNHHFVFPAHAGMDRIRTSRFRPKAWCSPHTRGWTEGGSARVGHGRVFPAHAGMDRRASAGRGWRRSCSPHTRGWTGEPPPVWRSR